MSDSEWQDIALDESSEGEDEECSQSSYEDECTGQHDKTCKECTDINTARLLQIRSRLVSNLYKIEDKLDDMIDEDSSWYTDFKYIIFAGIVVRIVMAYL